MADEIVILGGARTPMAEYNGVIRGYTEIELGAIAARAALERTGVAEKDVDHVVFGNAMQASGNAVYGARHVGLRAGIPDTVPALTVNRLCGSGIQSVINAAQMIRLGEADTVLAGGMESMSQAPFVIRGIRSGLRMGHADLQDSLLVSLRDDFSGCYMAETAVNLAREKGISREEQDRFALRSQKAAEAAYREGKFQEEIVPIKIQEKKKEFLLREDDHRRPDTTLEALAKLAPAFSREGTVTAGNASGIVDGGAAVLVESSSRAAARKRTPLGRIVSWGIAGVDPRIMGIGPVPASRMALSKAGLTLKDIDLIEVNEAFAGQYLAVEKELGLDRDRVNVNGGAIALGHPLGATGTRLILTALLELRRRQGHFARATACLGGGQGIAIILEAI